MIASMREEVDLLHRAEVERSAAGAPHWSRPPDMAQGYRGGGTASQRPPSFGALLKGEPASAKRPLRAH